MRHLRKATLALPALLIALGLAIPAVVGGRGSKLDVAPRVEQARYAGRTAGEWYALAMASLEGDEFGLALRYLKTAERVDAGSQYVSELHRVRRAGRRARDIEANRRRMLDGELRGLELDETGTVLTAHRSTRALPGESLWTLASGLVAARRGVPPSELDACDRDVYSAWDALTDMNGLRELAVGEVVRLPLPDEEAREISLANAEDMERMRLAHAALDSGRIERARTLRREMTSDFVLSSEALELLDRRIRESRVARLLASVNEIAASAPDIPRPSGHSELVASLRRATVMLDEVRELACDAPSPDVERVEALLSDAERFALNEDGTIATTKPSGVPYTEFARATVEWFLRRELTRSGMEYPHHAGKTDDELAWARYLMDASDLAARDGVDFAELLAEEGPRDVRLPNPGSYFHE